MPAKPGRRWRRVDVDHVAGAATTRVLTARGSRCRAASRRRPRRAPAAARTSRAGPAARTARRSPSGGSGSRVASTGSTSNSQPRAARHLHLGLETQPAVGLARLHAPEVQRVAGPHVSGSRRPRRMPTPPASRSSPPRRRHSRSAQYQPCVAADAPDGREGRRGRRVHDRLALVAQRTSRGVRPRGARHARRPRVGPPVRARLGCRRDSIARAIASRRPRGRTGNTSSARASRTTVALRMLPMSLRPTRA